MTDPLLSQSSSEQTPVQWCPFAPGVRCFSKCLHENGENYRSCLFLGSGPTEVPLSREGGING